MNLDMLLRRVGWTRGRGCVELAELVGGEASLKLEGDREAFCFQHRLDALVARKLTNFDLVSTIVPSGVDFDAVTSIVAAVGPGPHSPLATAVAARLGERLELPTEAVAVVRDEDESIEAKERLEDLLAALEVVSSRVIPGERALDLLEELPEGALLIAGAPGGSWLQRQLFGPGQRLLAKAPGGTIVVRRAPRRCFHHMIDPAGMVVGPHLSVGDARRVIAAPSAPVASDGKLVGIVRFTRAHDDRAPVGDVMEAATSVVADELSTAIGEVCDFLDHGIVPVVGKAGDLVGVFPCSEAEEQ